MGNTNNRNGIILLSGGIDSTACTHFLKSHKFNISGLFIDYGQKAARAELLASQNVAEYFNIDLLTCDLTSIPASSFASGEIIGRNAFLLFTALMISKIGVGCITLGIHQNTRYYDCSKTFWDNVSRLVSEYTDGRITTYLPFLDWNKRNVVDYCRRFSIPIELTYSCESSSDSACGKCTSCIDREILNVCTS